MGLFFNQTENSLLNINIGDVLENFISNAQNARLHFASLKSQHIASNSTTAYNQEVSDIKEFKSTIENGFIGSFAFGMEEFRQLLMRFHEALLKLEGKKDEYYYKLKQEHERLTASINLEVALLIKAREFLDWLNEWEQEVQSNQ